ncbi:MAG: hypothetical protein KDA42_17655, partial [Planctomycetales bacterium]|nr:hypothetical protein [Planctomycetales bacterium]
MKIAMGACLAVLATLVARPLGTSREKSSADQASPIAGQPTCSELILDLPEDGGAWWVTVCLPAEHHADPASRWLLAAMAVEPRLRSLQAQCRCHQFSSTDPMFQAKWSSYVGALPALLVQMPNGRTCYKASGDNLPSSPERLADEIAAAIENCRPCPRPTPQPEPEPAPRPAPVQPAMVPDIRPRSTPDDDQPNSVLPMLLAGLAGAAGGAASEWRRA